MRRITLLIGLASVLAAHYLYVMPVQFVVPPGAGAAVEFHSGDTFPTSQAPPVLERIRDAQVMWVSGMGAITGLRIHGQSAIAEFVAPTANGSLLTARTTPNFIELDAKKFEEYLQSAT